MELVSDSSWFSSMENLFDPLFPGEFMPFQEGSLPLDFSGFPPNVTQKEASAVPPVPTLAAQSIPPAPPDSTRTDTPCDTVDNVLAFPYPMFLANGLSLPAIPITPPMTDSVPTRKRRKRDTAPNLLPPPSQVSNLLKLEGVVDTVDSITFESFIAELRNFRSLSSAEELFIKKVTKKIKNRESARKSRQAKKDHNADLETRVNDLVDQTQELKIVCSSNLAF